MNLIGQPIKHRVFGAGIVTDLADGTVTICFQNGEKKFVYPDAFHNFLVLKDQKTQRHIEEQITNRKIAIQKERQYEQAEQERQQKLLNFKVVSNSHAVFHITPDQVDRTVQTHRVSTGTYLSGYSKGQPRIATRIKPNSVCLLTVCQNKHEEQKRCVMGAFMVREDFFGEDMLDGMIEGHPQHHILVPGESPVLFWEYFAQDPPPRWGNTAFKYCSGDVVNQILADMVKRLHSTEQEEAAIAFYRYFCRLNHLHPLIPLDGNAPEKDQS